MKSESARKAIMLVALLCLGLYAAGAIEGFGGQAGGLPEGWQVSKADEGTRSVVVQGPDGSCLLLEDNSSKAAPMVFAEMPSRPLGSLDFRIMLRADRPSDAFVYLLSGSKKICEISFSSKGNIKTRMADAQLATVGQYSPDSWLSVRLLWDSPRAVARLQVDGVVVADSLPLLESAVPNAFGFMVGGGSKMNMAAYIDDVASLEAEPFFSGSQGELVESLSRPSALEDKRGRLALPAILGDNMVLQYEARVRIWGWAHKGESVAVELAGSTRSAVAADGTWEVFFEGLKPGLLGDMRVSGGLSENPLVVRNVLAGDVWLASGQSNMKFTLANAAGGPEAASSAENDQIRLFVVAIRGADQPLEDVSGRWEVCTPQSASAFSAVGYWFARYLHAARRVPVGVILASVGGTRIVSYYRDAAIRANPLTQPFYQRYQNDLVVAARPGSLVDPVQYQPAAYYNAMIAPLQRFAIRGALWYQGETDSWNYPTYRSMSIDMIRDWREAWGLGDFPFLFVQLPGFNGKDGADVGYPAIREIQRQVALAVPNTAMVVTIDLGEEKNIHPVRKEAVGQRLALAARALVYGENVEYRGPRVRSVTYGAGAVQVEFDHVGSGLRFGGETPEGFALSGDGQRFVPARARVVARDRVELWSDEVPGPKAVRYAYAGFPLCNLQDSEGLPASPFEHIK